MRKLTGMLMVSAASMMLFSCQKDANLTAQDDAITESELAQVRALGFGTSDIQRHEDGLMVEGDIVLTKEYLNSKPAYLQLRTPNAEQYHTTNTVKGLPRTIKVSLSGRNITQRLIDGVKGAVNRYNAENLSLTFSYVGTSGGGDINITVVNTGQYIASAGFPTSTGAPFNSIKFAKTYTNYALGFVTSVMAHEIGHCIGYRHTDYMQRQYSCGGSPVNEGASTVGAVHIPGTPTGPDPNSWMLACLSATTDRPFNANDKTALNYLY